VVLLTLKTRAAATLLPLSMERKLNACLMMMMMKGYRARKSPAYNVASSHAQQCAEKYLKGRLLAN
jgi:HEPN domain-containing protein